ncbi:MAG: type I restriction enzyme HsdR N-terminal domain-containing protein [Saprospiraceae bacterium]
MNWSEYNIDLGLLSHTSKFKTKSTSEGRYVFDPIRKKYLIILPEEAVRQACISWLLDYGISRNRIQVEKSFDINGLNRRFDIVIYDKIFNPYIIVECKAPNVSITQKTFDQIMAYQTVLNATYIMVTNGMATYFARLDMDNKKYIFYDSIPRL